MLIVREVFTAKPGQASRLAKLCKKMMSAEVGIRVMTDLVGQYNTVVVETQVADLAEWEKQMELHRSGQAIQDIDAETKEEMSHYTEMFLTGHREIFRIVE
ncbi:MAG: hypothetical protein KBB55_01435 [Candidatus Buchananbacteria bacterium]|nr:hypothetical protein [Candidatus Buchananbacteria bacterium]